MTLITPEAVEEAEDLIDDGMFEEAALLVETAIASLGDLEMLSRAACARGQAFLGPLVRKIIDPTQENPHQDMFKEPWKMFHLALKLDPDNELAASNIRNMSGVMGEGPDAEIEPNHSETFDVIIVGAGASGVGVALSLTKIFGLDPTRVLLVERGKAVGETFRRWPKEMRFISPSFNQQGWTSSFDLNSVAYGTSPAYTLGAEHPTGIQYARYLSALADEANLNVRTLTEVTAVRPFADGVCFI